MAQPYVGEIRIFAGNFAPAGWAFCDGSLIPIEDNETLFMLIGTTYGGDGQTTFALPDLRGRVPIHAGQSRLTGTNYSLGQLGGTEAVTLNSGQLPMHTHQVSASSQAGESTSLQNQVWASSSAKPYAAGAPTGAMNPAAIASSGGNQPHENMMPFLTTNYIISLFGIYPTSD